MPAAEKPKFSRSRGGCLPCRIQRKKCSETHPICQRCERLGRACCWPDKKLSAKDLLELRNGGLYNADDSADDGSRPYDANALARMMRSAPDQERFQNPGGLSPQAADQQQQQQQASASPHSAIASPAASSSTNNLDMLTQISVGGADRPASTTPAPIPSTSSPEPPQAAPDLLPMMLDQQWPMLDVAGTPEDGHWSFIDQSLNFLMEPAGLLDSSYFEPWKEPQSHLPEKITADYIRMLIHYTGTVGYRCFIDQFAESVIPAYRSSKMLWATARAYHGSYVRQLFAMRANQRDYSEHPARALAIQAMEQELQQVLATANGPQIAVPGSADDLTNESEATLLMREGEALLDAALHSPAPALTFKEILGTLLNIVGYNHTVNGTEAFWAAADRCVEFVQTYQPAKPTAFDVGAAQGLEYRPLCVWIALDVSSAVARGTKTNSIYVQQTVVQDPFDHLQGLEWLTKASDAIFVVLAQAAVLAHDLAGRSPRPGAEQERADQVWRNINSSTSPVNSSVVSSRVICLIFHEIWREGVRIYFHQIVCKRNLLYPALRTSVESLLSLISLLETSRRTAPPALGLPLWMGAAAAITVQERHRFRSTYKTLGPSAAWRDTLQDLEKLWTLTDANGDPQYWPELVSQGIIRPPAFR